MVCLIGVLGTATTVSAQHVAQSITSSDESLRSRYLPTSVGKKSSKNKTARNKRSTNRTSSSAGDIRISFDPKQHGFAFPNWSGSFGDDLANDETLRRLFGDKSICKSIEGSACTVYESVPSVLQRLNSEIVKGRCEGMALLALHRFSQGIPGTSELTRSDVAQELSYWSSTQMLPSVRIATTRSRNSSLREFVQGISLTLQNGDTATLAMHGEFGDHTVVPYSITTSGSVVQIDVYDPNQPMALPSLILDTATDTWRYSPDASSNGVTWSGHKGSLSYVPFSARYQQPTLAFESGR